jgi:hypothetical protein
MKPSENDKRLDERIRDAVGREQLTFDFDKWKAGHQKQIELFKSTVSKEVAVPGQVSVWLIIAKSRLIRLAAAAVVIVAAGVLFYSKDPPDLIKESTTVRVEKTPAELLTVMSLNLAYRRGGMEELDEQFDEALRKLGPRRSRIMLSQLLMEFNGG